MKKIKHSYSDKKKYEEYQYKGLIGWLMKYDHKMLEKNLPKKNYSKVLEIGPGFHSHQNYIKHNFDEYCILEKEKNKLFFHKKIKNKKIRLFKYKKNNQMPFKKKYFDRIIMCHVLEHINQPEMFIIETMSKLKKGGVLSLALPTDPFFLWRMGRLFSKIFFVKKKQNISSVEYDYLNAIDHVNSVFSLHSIINFHYGKNIIESYLPFRLKTFDLNLFYNVHIIK